MKSFLKEENISQLTRNRRCKESRRWLMRNREGDPRGRHCRTSSSSRTQSGHAGREGGAQPGEGPRPRLCLDNVGTGSGSGHRHQVGAVSDSPRGSRSGATPRRRFVASVSSAQRSPGICLPPSKPTSLLCYHTTSCRCLSTWIPSCPTSVIAGVWGQPGWFVTISNLTFYDPSPTPTHPCPQTTLHALQLWTSGAQLLIRPEGRVCYPAGWLGVPLGQEGTRGRRGEGPCVSIPRRAR